VLRGLDASAAARSDYEPPVVRVAGREPLDATATVYVHAEPSPSCHRRFGAALDRLELLVDAGLLESVRAVAWPARVTPSCEAEPAVRQLVCAFHRAAGHEALDPWFEVDADGLAVPELALVLRRADGIADLYPRRTDAAEVPVETGLERLCTGRDREPLAQPPEAPMSALPVSDGASGPGPVESDHPSLTPP